MIKQSAVLLRNRAYAKSERSSCPGAAAHYWVIDERGHGVCKRCMEERDFPVWEWTGKEVWMGEAL